MEAKHITKISPFLMEMKPLRTPVAFFLSAKKLLFISFNEIRNQITNLKEHEDYVSI